jgi:hypothetical protein
MDLISKLKTGFHRPLRAKLIFNPGSGQAGESLQQLASIISEMQDQQILPEVYTTRPDSQLEDVVHNAIKSGIKLIVVEVMQPLASSPPAHAITWLLTWGSPGISRVLWPCCARAAA